MSARSIQHAGRAARVRLARVRKRDGREVPYDKRKIEAAVGAALDAVGEADPAFAAEVADVVELALVDRFLAEAGRDAADARGDRPVEAVPSIEAIQDLVERALIELGRAQVAKAYILYRDRRARAREALRVDPSVPGPGGRVGRVRVREADGPGDWSKGRIVAALMDEAELTRATAEEVAARVERRLFASGLKRVNTGLIRELVAGELVDLGLEAALRRQAAVGMPRHDLRRLLRDPAAVEWEPAYGGDREPAARRGARGVEGRAAGEILRRFALEDVLGEGVAELHAGGDLDVVEIERPHQPLVLSLSADLLLEGEPRPAGAWEVLGRVGELLRGVSRGLVLEDPGVLLAPLARATREKSPQAVGAFLRGLAGVARAAGKGVGIGTPGPRHPGLAVRLIQELAPLAGEAFAPTLYLAAGDLETALADGAEPAAAEHLLAQGRLVPTFGGRETRCVAPGCHRRRREAGALAASGAVALNLPRLARRAGPWREEAFLGSLADLVRCAVEVLRRLHAFQTAGGSPPAAVAARPSFALVPVGLREALRVLGDGEVDPERGARWIGLVAEAARRFAGPGLPPIVASGFFGDESRARLAWLDRRERVAGEGGQRWLFADAELRREAGSGPSGAYSTGFVLSPVRGLAPGQAEAELCRTLDAGALPLAHGIAPLDEVDPEAPRPHLAAWRRFHELTRVARPAGPADDVLFPARPRGRTAETPPASAAPLAQEPA